MQLNYRNQNKNMLHHNSRTSNTKWLRDTDAIKNLMKKDNCNGGGQNEQFAKYEDNTQSESG